MSLHPYKGSSVKAVAVATAVAAALAASQFGRVHQQAAAAAKPARHSRRTMALPAQQEIPAADRGTLVFSIKSHGQKVFALTFDDGPWPIYTDQVVKILRQNHIHATFFVVGAMLRAHPELGREVLASGNVVGNHSWTHPSRPAHPDVEVARTDAAIKAILGFRPHLFRPPYGILKNGMASYAKREGDAVILWSASAADWKRPGAGSIASNIVAQARPGGIALLHDGGGDRSQTVAALSRIIRELKAKGYRFVTIPELLRMQRTRSRRKP